MIIRSTGALLCAAMLLLPLPARAEPVGVLIKGSTAIVAILALAIKGGQTVASGKTDAKGNLTFSELPTGKYELRIGAIPLNAMGPNKTAVITISVGGEKILAKTAKTMTFTTESSREIVIFASLPHAVTSYPFPVGSNVGMQPRTVTINVSTVPPTASPL